ncbi:hypothetical protein [Novosphingobium clariflavum]|uniref:Uncharacterized protein n=1 Tax=Novosphingobium clariflavum TaxID=2029884 RepID=A0ABV6SC20_9SPHN|nr:hypothetical protein [Novosphingobium clariflavum]
MSLYDAGAANVLMFDRGRSGGDGLGERCRGGGRSDKGDVVAFLACVAGSLLLWSVIAAAIWIFFAGAPHILLPLE